jgi:hypothetical protein
MTRSAAAKRMVPAVRVPADSSARTGSEPAAWPSPIMGLQPQPHVRLRSSCRHGAGVSRAAADAPPRQRHPPSPRETRAGPREPVERHRGGWGSAVTSPAHLTAPVYMYPPRQAPQPNHHPPTRRHGARSTPRAEKTEREQKS